MIVIQYRGLFLNFGYDPNDMDDDQWIPYTPGDGRIFGSLAALAANGVLDIPVPAVGLYLKIGFIKRYSGASHYHLTKIEIKNLENKNKYVQPMDNVPRIRVPLDKSAKEDATVNVDFWKYKYGWFAMPNYHVFVDSQRNLTLKVRKKTSITELELLMGKMAMSATDQTNRVISTRYNVRDDTFELQIMGNQYF